MFNIPQPYQHLLSSCLNKISLTLGRRPPHSESVWGLKTVTNPHLIISSSPAHAGLQSLAINHCPLTGALLLYLHIRKWSPRWKTEPSPTSNDTWEDKALHSRMFHLSPSINNPATSTSLQHLEAFSFHARAKTNNVITHDITGPLPWPKPAS